MLPEISVIIPVYNEESNIRTLHKRLTDVLNGLSFELIFINDGSQDQSLNIIRGLSENFTNVKYVDFSRNFGHQIAVTAGLNFCRGQKVVIIDADLQDPPELIPKMLEKLDAGWNMVYAKRNERRGEGLLKRLTAKIFYRVLTRLTSINIPVDTGDFRVMDRKIVDAFNRMPEQHKFIRGLVSWIGFKQTYVEYDRDKRHGGKTGYTYRKMLSFALDGITGFSTRPLKLASYAGFIVSAISFLMILYTLYGRFIIKNYEPGWASIMISILFIGGIQLICLGVIGEYLIRIDSNIRQRPLYIINETNIEP